jgi:hypothetical protein
MKIYKNDILEKIIDLNTPLKTLIDTIINEIIEEFNYFLKKIEIPKDLIGNENIIFIEKINLLILDY